MREAVLGQPVCPQETGDLQQTLRRKENLCDQGESLGSEALTTIIADANANYYAYGILCAETTEFLSSEGWYFGSVQSKSHYVWGDNKLHTILPSFWYVLSGTQRG